METNQYAYKSCITGIIKIIRNKFGKCLIYAIGEIVLVVIGILIALAINNWNELKKERKYEYYILNEIGNNLAANEVQSSIKDIENVFLNEFQEAYEKYLSNSEYGVKVAFTKYPNPEMNKWVLNELIVFRQNNFETTKKVGKFQRMSKS